MANSPQAKKRARQADKRGLHNASLRSNMRTVIKNFLKNYKSEGVDARGLYTKIVPILDRLSGKGLIHKNKAARLKSRLNQRVKAVSSDS